MTLIQQHLEDLRETWREFDPVSRELIALVTHLVDDLGRFDDLGYGDRPLTCLLRIRKADMYIRGLVQTLHDMAREASSMTPPLPPNVVDLASRRAK